MPLRFMNRNILTVPGDVIVNPSDGVSFCDNNISKAIATAGGDIYTDAISKLVPLKLGTAAYTQAGSLPFMFVAHVALPDWYGGNVIMMQVENEYGYYGDDKQYLERLVSLYREQGMDVPLFTSDGTKMTEIIDGSVEACRSTASHLIFLKEQIPS